MSIENKFYHKPWLKDVMRVHPPVDEQKVDERLRLHRAERLEPFPQNFISTFFENISEKDIRYYPYIHELKQQIAMLHDLKPHNIFLNNGSSENIRVFYDAFAISKKNVIITNPCYPMHKLYAQLHNSNIIEINYRKNNSILTSDIIHKIDSDTCCIVLANPNSPIGDYIDISNVEKIISKCSEHNIPVLIDEAYIEYSEKPSCLLLLSKYENVIISRTFSKAMGCAGLRIGYMMGNDDIMEVAYRFIPTYEISSLSAKFGLHLLKNQDIINSYVKSIIDEKKKIKEICDNLNIPCILNYINTIFIKPKNIEVVKKHWIENKVIFRTRILPYDNDEWLSIVVFPNISKHWLFTKLYE